LAVLSTENGIVKIIDLENILRDLASKQSLKIIFLKDQSTSIMSVIEKLDTKKIIKAFIVFQNFRITNIFWLRRTDYTK